MSTLTSSLMHAASFVNRIIETMIFFTKQNFDVLKFPISVCQFEPFKLTEIVRYIARFQFIIKQNRNCLNIFVNFQRSTEAGPISKVNISLLVRPVHIKKTPCTTCEQTYTAILPPPPFFRHCFKRLKF